MQKRRGWLRWIVAVGGGLVLLVSLMLGGGWLWVHHALQAQLPQIDGERHTRALVAPVTVRRDQAGVPHLQAQSVDDLLAAQGYVAAQDRLWQMDMLRRVAAGEIAELLGSRFVAHDRTQRVLQMRQTAERLTASLSPQDRRYLEDYARGVNAYIAETDVLPTEFRLLHYQPQRWQPVDSLLIVLNMVQTLDEQWPTKLAREQVTRRLGPTLAADLYPTGSWRDHPPTQSAPDLTQPPTDTPPPLPDEESSLAPAEDILHLRAALHPFEPASGDPCRTCNPGSNEWAVSGTRTASGRPLLSNDMHLDHSIPGIWYEMDLAAPGFHAAGVSLPGVPFIIAGHNDHVAWGYTALYGDTQDIYTERINAQGDYWDGAAWRPMEHDREVIHVRFAADQVVDVTRTLHGPVLTPLLPHESRTLSLRWSVYDPQFASGLPIYGINTAADWQQMQAALAQWWAPTLNVVYADDQGHIAYQAIGHLPQRPGGLQGTPIADGLHEWQGPIPFALLPSALDPPSGILATANSRVTPDNNPTPVTLEWAAPYRNERIWKWLSSHEKVTRADMLALQTDINSDVDHELAQRFAYAIDHAQHTTPRLRQAADLLRSWDGVLRTSEAAPTILNGSKAAFWRVLLRPRLGTDWTLYEWPESAFAEEQLITTAPAAWLPSQYASWNDLLADAVNQGIAVPQAPASLRDWNYGDAHPVELVHPLYAMLPFMGWTGVGPLPQSGDTTTVKQVSRGFGPSQRFTMDWSDVDQSTENIVMGQSGDPLSPWYRDQWPLWYEGTTIPLAYTPAAVQSVTEHTLRLLP